MYLVVKLVEHCYSLTLYILVISILHICMQFGNCQSYMHDMLYFLLQINISVIVHIPLSVCFALLFVGQAPGDF